MEPKRVSAFTGLLNFLSNPIGPLKMLPESKTPTDIIVNTALPGDTQIWETGVRKPNTEWIIVEQYEDEEHANAGHHKWVKLLTEYPDFPVKDINLWSLPEDIINEER